MPNKVFDTNELLGYRLLSDEETSGDVVVSVKAGGKTGHKQGNKPVAEKSEL